MQDRPEGIRLTGEVDPEKIDKLHRVLSGVVIQHTAPGKMTYLTLRAKFVEIRTARNKVFAVISKLLPKLGRLNRDLARINAFIEATAGDITINTSDLTDYKNEKQRKARLRELMPEWYEAKDDIVADLHLVQAVVDHAKWVREELRYAFEEASRALASKDLEKRLGEN